GPSATRQPSALRAISSSCLMTTRFLTRTPHLFRTLPRQIPTDVSPARSTLRKMVSAGVAFLGLSLGCSAAVTFTFHVTANETKLGYVSGQAATVVFTLNDYSPTPPAGQVGGDETLYQWYQFESSAPLLWSNVTGTGLTGTWTPPVDPYSSLA